MTDEQTTLARVTRTIADLLGKDSSTITPDSTLCGDLGADQLDLVEIAMDLEDVFKIDLPDALIQSCETVGEMVEKIDRAIAKGMA